MCKTEPLPDKASYFVLFVERPVSCENALYRLDTGREVGIDDERARGAPAQERRADDCENITSPTCLLADLCKHYTAEGCGVCGVLLTCNCEEPDRPGMSHASGMRQ